MEKQKRFNALDFAILLVIVLCIAALIVRYVMSGREGSGKTQTYEITFTASDVRYSAADAFITGDRVYIEGSGAFIGTFSRLDSNRPASVYTSDLSGGLVKLYYPESTRVDLTGTITSEGVMNSEGFFSEGTTYLSPGMKLKIYTPHLITDVTILSITPSAG
ncbi:MAG: DUF4330 family protein [Eubacteriales bacterium]